jgi:two-component system NtrC family response regulator
MERNARAATPARVVVAEDDAASRKLVVDFLGDLGCTVSAFSSGAEVWAHLAGNAPPDCLLLDIRLPGIDGLEIFRRVHESWPQVAVILITGQGSTHEAVQAMKDGAHYYFTKPIDFLLLRRTVSELLERRRLEDALARASGADADHGIVGGSPEIRAVRERIDLVADLPATVLITGETGTGKELVARAVHARGGRRDAPFVAVNCAAVPENLLESELFGFERGAFTGAARSKPGKLELAEGGTLLLDEIGDMPMSLQGKLLRVIEDRLVERLGGTSARRVDVRFLAATNRDLERRVREGSFRDDLYHRLNLFPIALPPLRERRDDIPLLAHHLLGKLALAYRKEIREIEPAVVEALLRHDWPGNVRELRHVLEGAVIVCQGPVLLRSQLPPRPAWSGRPAGESPSRLEELERKALVEALERCGGNQSAAARELSISRNQLRYKLKKHGLDG